MYEAFYGLREKPFNLTPDPKYLFLSEKHKEALGHLIYGISSHSGFVMVSGEIGTGKTTICRNLLKQLDSKTELAFIFNPPLNPVDLVRKINSEFGIDASADNLLDLVDILNAYLLQASAAGKSCVLIIDEAQNLSPTVLEQIRLLSNIETETEKLLQIVLIGQPELIEMLALKELRQLNQRITARYHLKPLGEKETMQYIAYRIHVAGGRRKVRFSRSAVRSVFRLSGGTPRVINAICDRGLLIGYTKEARVISAAIVKRAAREVRGERPPSQQFWVRLKKNWLPSPTVAVLAALVVVLVVWFAPPLQRIALEMRAFNSIASTSKSSASEDAQTANANTDTGALPKAPGLTAPRGPSLIIDTVAGIIAEQNKPEPPAPSPEELFADMLAALAPEEARNAAGAALAAAWKREVKNFSPRDDSVAGLSEFAAAHGLAHQHLTPALDQLTAVGLPAFVRMEAGGVSRWLALLGAQDNTLLLSSAPGEAAVEVSRAVFLRHYLDEALIPWLDKRPNTNVMLSGQANAAVGLLKGQLRLLERLPESNTNNRYDGLTATAVSKIQAETGLLVDGIAGRQVRMILSSWLPDEGTPSLMNMRQTAADADAAGKDAGPREGLAKRKLLDGLLSDSPAAPVRAEALEVTETAVAEAKETAPPDAAATEMYEQAPPARTTTDGPGIDVQELADPVLDFGLTPLIMDALKETTTPAGGGFPLRPHGKPRE